jgi:hypothetical protein
MQEAPLEALLANLTDTWGLPPGSLSIDDLQPANQNADGTVAIASEGSPGPKRLLLSSAAASNSQAQPAKAAGQGPLMLTTTVTIDPEAVAGQDSGVPLSAASVQAALVAAIAAQGLDAPVALDGAQAARVGICGNGVCEVGERPVQGVTSGTCPEDCGFATKVGCCLWWATPVLCRCA